MADAANFDPFEGFPGYEPPESPFIDSNSTDPEASAAPDAVIDEEEAVRAGRIRRAVDGVRAVGLKHSVELLLVGAEMSPLNEVIRFGTMAAAIKAGWGPLAVFAASGAATGLIEAPGSVAAADLLDTDLARGIVEKVNDKVEKIGLDRNARIHPVAKAGLGYLAGSPAMVILKQREDPSRTMRTNIEYGLKTTGALMTATGAQGYLIAAGLEHPNPETISGLLVALGTIFGLGGVIKKRLSRQAETSTDSSEEE